MDYNTFFEKFGGSARTKHGRFRPCRMPEKSGLPQEFIRLCPWEIDYLYSVARRTKRGIVETGRYKGGSAFLLACAAPAVPIFSIDIAPVDDQQLRSYFTQHSVGQNVQLLVGDSKVGHFGVGPIDLLFIDGDHSYQGCLGDITNWYDHLATDGHLVLHDCHLWDGYGVQDAVVDFMATHPELQVILPPFMGREHWNYPAGSLAHLIKRGS